MNVVLLLDLIGTLTALAAAWLWLVASGRRVRRISRNETLDAADINRIVTAINRSAALNRRGALAAGLSALAVALRFMLDMLPS